VFVYDTSKDSDGGAWRTGALAQASSWYNETLNTATRGSRREFPVIAVIVAESNKVTIYDGDDPSLPMWMVFNAGTYAYIRGTSGITSTSASNGKFVVGDAASGVAIWDMVSDESEASIGYNTTGFYVTLPVSGRNNAISSYRIQSSDVVQIINANVNDVAMTVLPDAPIDPATGLPVPTIACLVAETEVTMADGSTKRLDQVQPGEMVKTLEGEHKVLNWWDQGIKDVIELEFDGGQKLICTADHKIRTTEGWVEAGDLTEEHEVISL
jgi:hypothetical protein